MGARSDRLLSEGIVEVYVHGGDIQSKAVSFDELPERVTYICTDFERELNNKVVDVDLYEDNYGNYYGVINW